MTLDELLECVGLQAEAFLKPQSKAVFKKTIDPYFEEVSAFRKNLEASALLLKKEINNFFKKNSKSKFLDMYNRPGKDYIRCSNSGSSPDTPYFDIYYPFAEHKEIWGWIPQKAYENEPLKRLLSYANWPGPKEQNLTMFQFAIVAILHDAPRLKNGCNLIYYGSGDDLADRAALKFIEVVGSNEKCERMIYRLKNAFDTVKIKLGDNAGKVVESGREELDRPKERIHETQNTPTYQEYLIDIASKTHRLIKSNEKRFRERVQQFLSRFDKWASALIEGQQSAIDNKPELYLGKEPGSFDENGADLDPDGEQARVDHWWAEAEANKPEGYVIHDPYDYYPFSLLRIPECDGYYYAPLLPDNPVDTLRPKDYLVLIYPDRCIDKNTPMIKREPRSDEEDLLRKYFLLAVIHSMRGHGGQLVEQDPEPWADPSDIALQGKAVEYRAVELVWEMWDDFDDRKEHFWGATMRALIKAAMFDVEVDLRTGGGQASDEVAFDTMEIEDQQTTSSRIERELKAKTEGGYNGQVLELDLTKWSKSVAYDIVVAVINDTEREGVSITNKRRLYAVKERLQKEVARTSDARYKEFSDSDQRQSFLPSGDN